MALSLALTVSASGSWCGGGSQVAHGSVKHRRSTALEADEKSATRPGKKKKDPPALIL